MFYDPSDTFVLGGGIATDARSIGVPQGATPRRRHPDDLEHSHRFRRTADGGGLARAAPGRLGATRNDVRWIAVPRGVDGRAARMTVAGSANATPTATPGVGPVRSVERAAGAVVADEADGGDLAGGEHHGVGEHDGVVDDEPGRHGTSQRLESWCHRRGRSNEATTARSSPRRHDPRPGGPGQRGGDHRRDPQPPGHDRRQQ